MCQILVTSPVPAAFGQPDPNQILHQTGQTRWEPGSRRVWPEYLAKQPENWPNESGTGCQNHPQTGQIRGGSLLMPSGTLYEMHAPNTAGRSRIRGRSPLAALTAHPSRFVLRLKQTHTGSEHLGLCARQCFTSICDSQPTRNWRL